MVLSLNPYVRKATGGKFTTELTQIPMAIFILGSQLPVLNSWFRIKLSMLCPAKMENLFKL